MDKEKFDLNKDALNKIDEQYEYADERTANDPFAQRASAPKHRPVTNGAAAAKPKKPVRRQDQVKSPKQGAVQKKALRQTAAKGQARAAAAFPMDGGREQDSVRQPRPKNAAEEESTVQGESRRHKLLRFYRRFAAVMIILGIIYIGLNVGFLYFRGQLWFNEPRARDYPVRGAVVSSELGEVDWTVFQYQPLKFAYVRATKGTKFVDEQFKANKTGIDESRLWAGYYHEFDFSETGAKQAEHFIKTVGFLDGDLRPAVKLTAYGIYGIRMKSTDTVKKELGAFLKAIRKEYGRRAVIMCDSDCYEKYIKPYFSDQTLWIIDHFAEPSEDMNWALWEYNPRVRSEGYSNKGEYYAVTVYRFGKDMSNFRKNFEIGYETDE